MTDPLPVSTIPEPPGREVWVHREATVNGLHFHYVEAGAGPLVVLLHGFPEFWYSWRHQLPALAGAGFHAVAPDLRGYNESAKPAGVRNYRLKLLTADVAGLIRRVGAGPAVVVGHDWGGVIAWNLALAHPGVVDRLVILNAPHPAAFLRELRNPAQWLRSAYILFFQLPWLPERVIAAGGYALLERLFSRQPMHARAFSFQDIGRCKEALARPGALTAALNYYRALIRYPRDFRKGLHPIPVPTLVIWGEQDPYLGTHLTEGLERWVPRLRVVRLPDASHWVQNDAPERVNQLLLGFLAESGTSPNTTLMRT